ncbi:MAG: L-threonylcarbamoyladenylate synthase [Rhodospirillales bacterium]|nr:L-threonylcarbamoyladenylate synthase [Rhodospirillales bacterium]
MTRSDTETGPPCLAPTQAAIARAARVIREGGLVGLPTDTVYGLAADATDDNAVTGVFRAKGRQPDKPLIALIATRAMAEACADFAPPARALAERFWPGPLTLVLPRAAASPLSPLVHQGAPGVSLRIPGNEIARAVVEAAGRPLTAPSANPSGAPSPLTASEVVAGLGAHVALVIDDGPADGSLASTLLDLTGAIPRLLRPGVVTADAIERVIGPIDCGG